MLADNERAKCGSGYWIGAVTMKRGAIWKIWSEVEPQEFPRCDNRLRHCAYSHAAVMAEGEVDAPAGEEAALYKGASERATCFSFCN